MPATTPTSYEALTVDYAIEMLANSATFRTLVGAIDAAAARGFIVNGWGGDPQTAGGEGRTTMADGTVKARPANYGLVSPDDPVVRREMIAFREYMNTGRINLFIIRQISASDNAELVMVRGRNELGAIESEIRAQFGVAGRLLAGDTETLGPSLPSAVGSKRLTLDMQIIITWRDVA